MLSEQLQKYYVDFDQALGKGTGYFRQVEQYSNHNLQTYNLFKEIYAKNNFLKIEIQTEPRIPKIIHQIWIGNREIPKILQEYQTTWKKHNPDWEYKLWTNQDIKNYQFANPNLKTLFDRPLTLGERVDVVRYDILYQHGGVYADCDCICLKSFNMLAHGYDFFAGICQPMFAQMDRAIFLQNCLIGAKPNHPIIEKVGSLMYENWDNTISREDAFFTTLQRTFLALTYAALTESNKDGNIDILMPPTYFFPINPYPVLDFMIRGTKETVLGIFRPELAPYSSFKDYSFSNHYSSKEWLKDIYATITLGSVLWSWSLFKPKNWLLLLRSKLFNQESQKKIVRETFNELLIRSGDSSN